MNDTLNKILTAQGGYLNILLALVLLLAILYWIHLIFVQRNLKKALFLQILMLPVTYKSLNLVGIIVYDNTPGYSHILGLTSLGIFIIFIVSKYLFKNSITDKNQKVIIIYYFVYAFIGTLVQFNNHKMMDAFWLSYWGYWQYLLFIVVLFHIIKTSSDIDQLLVVFTISIVFGIFIRIINDGYMIVPSNMVSSMSRPGTNSAFGKLGQYGCYLTLAIYFVTYLFMKSDNGIKKTLFGITILFILIEMFANLTRGAVLQLVFLLFVPFFSSKRREVLMYYLVIFVFSLLIAGPLLYQLVSTRGFEFSLNFFSGESSVSTRYFLWEAHFPLMFSNYGLGYGIALEPHIYVGKAFIESGFRDMYLPSHNFIITEVQRSSIIAFIFFMVMFFKILKELFRKVRHDLNMQAFTVNSFVFFGLVSWIFYAQTSSLTLTYYETIEGNLILFMLLSVSVISSKINSSNIENV